MPPTSPTIPLVSAKFFDFMLKFLPLLTAFRVDQFIGHKLLKPTQTINPRIDRLIFRINKQR